MAIRYLQNDLYSALIAFSPFRLVCGIWNLDDKESFSDPFKVHTDGIAKVIYSPNRARIVSESNNGTIKIWRAANGSLVANPSIRRMAHG